MQPGSASVPLVVLEMCQLLRLLIKVAVSSLPKKIKIKD
jgi:hypothetical protein